MSGYYGGPPQQGGYGGPPPQQGYGHPPPGQHQQYGAPPPQQGYGQPPPGQYGAPPQGPPPGQYGAPPPMGHHQQPHAGHYGAPPPGQYGAPPPGPPPGQYGAPPPGQYGAPPGAHGGYQQAPTGPPAPPSPGYVPNQMSNQNLSGAADALRKAMKGFGTDEKTLIQILAPMDPIQINGVKAAFRQGHNRDLLKDVHSETSSYFREGLEAVIRGPLEQDCFTLREGLGGMGTKENLLDEVLLGRTNADINAIKMHYQQMYKRSLESDMKSDLSGKTERLYGYETYDDMVLAARRTEESAPINPQQIDQNVNDLYKATEGQMGTDELQVCAIISSASTAQLRAISDAYQRRYQRTLVECIRKEFSGHMEDALLYMVYRATDPAKHDADMLEATMAGAGTKDEALVRRITMIHWNRDRLQQCKGAYKHFYKRELAERIKGETRGDLETLLVAMVSA